MVKLLHHRPATAANMRHAFTYKLNVIPQPMRKRLTRTQGREIAMHKKLTEQTGMSVYFYDLHSPWQRGAIEKTNGLTRLYLPKGTDFSGYTEEQLDAIANEINSGPSKGHGIRSTLTVYRKLLLNSPQHSSFIH